MHMQQKKTLEVERLRYVFPNRCQPHVTYVFGPDASTVRLFCRAWPESAFVGKRGCVDRLARKATHKTSQNPATSREGLSVLGYTTNNIASAI